MSICSNSSADTVCDSRRFNTFLIYVTAGEVAGKVNLRHIFEIAKIKQQDYWLEITPLKDICQMLIANARRMGILVERNIDPEEYREFLIERNKYLVEKRKRLDEEKEAKILRTTV